LNGADRIAAMPAWRRAADGLVFAAAALLAMLALGQLARHQLREHLDASAADTLGALIHDQTPHRWRLHEPAGVIAGRAFGSEDSAFVADGFRIRSQGHPIDVGLVLSGAVDLSRYPRLEAVLDMQHAGTLAILVRESLDGPLCMSAANPVAAGASRISLALNRTNWTCAATAAEPPRRAAMLRLRIELPAGANATVHEVLALPSKRLKPEALESLELPLLPSPRDAQAFHRALERTALNSVAGTWPVLQLPLDGRVEQSLVARDEIRAAMPDSVIFASGDFGDVARLARAWKPQPPTVAGSPMPVILAGIYAALLLLLRLKPPLDQGPRAGLELLGVVAAPVTLVVGGHIGDNITAIQLAVCATTLIFALSLLIGGAPSGPSARTLKRGWWVALGSLALTVALILLLTGGHLGQGLPQLHRVAFYLAWAAIQQFLICVIVAERIERLTGSANWGLFGAALIFSLLHTPNAMLMQLTFVGGLIWVWNWQRHRALLANIVAHAACGLLLATSLPRDWLHSAEVSARFFLPGGP
jgi:membrane protease YdiL (CAAX protease family)